MIKVAGYCRVSTLKEDQANSFEAQQRYFCEEISKRADWELYEIYADEGISGTSTHNRTEFNRMISDALEGKFQLILTKEISRFSRNLQDTLRYTRELKAHGVGVLFENEHLNTLTLESEMYLSILGSVAQEESRHISNRVKWGQTRQMEQGIVFGRSLLGYDVLHGKITVEPQGAELVWRIFHKYGVEKKGASIIAKELCEEGFCTYTGNTKWSSSHIIKILKNEKYTGDLVQKKTYTPDYLTHQKKTNHGAEEKIILRNHHEPIVSRELWEQVQAEMQRRSKHGAADCGHSSRYIFSGKIRCGECGGVFVAKSSSRKNGQIRRWRCYTASTEGRRRVDTQGNEKGCDVGKLLRDDTAVWMLKEVLHSLQIDRETIAAHVASLATNAILSGQKGNRDTVAKLEQELRRIAIKTEKMMDSYFAGDITRQEMENCRSRYAQERERIHQRLETAQQREAAGQDTKSIQKRISREVTALLNGETESEILYKNLLDHAVVYRDGRVELYLSHLPKPFLFLPKNNCSISHC